MEMKKVFIFALAATFSFSSCTEVLEPRVDFGEVTYTNDYSKLIEAVNDLKQTLSDRVTSLNNMLDDKLATMTVSIDRNTGAIESQTTTLDGAVTELQVKLFDGFAALTEQQKASGEKIVTAINSGGEVISARLDAGNKLIETGVVGKLDEINSTLASQESTFAAKMDKLGDLVSSGLVKIENANGKLGTIGDKLTDLNASLGDVKGQLAAVDGSVIDVNKTLGELNTSVGTLGTTIGDRFTVLSNTVDSVGRNIVSAIDGNGNLLQTGFDTVGGHLQAVSQTFTEFKADFQDSNMGIPGIIEAVGQLEEKLVEQQKVIGTDLEALTLAQKENIEKLLAQLELLLNDADIYTPSDGAMDRLYVGAEFWNAIKDHGTSMSYNKIMEALEEPFLPTVKYLHGHISSVVEITSSETRGDYGETAWVGEQVNEFQFSIGESTKLVAGNKAVYPEYDNKELYLLVKIPDGVDCNLYNDISGCEYQFFRTIRFRDAKGMHTLDLNSQKLYRERTATIENLSLYDEKTETILTQLNIVVVEAKNPGPNYPETAIMPDENIDYYFDGGF